ncbi:hypothetical protein AC249_AIPGENE27337, partial [Exaiptasia diaphana]
EDWREKILGEAEEEADDTQAASGVTENVNANQDQVQKPPQIHSPAKQAEARPQRNRRRPTYLKDYV